MDVRPIDANELLQRRRNFGKPYALDPIDKNIDDQLVDLRHVLKAPTLDYAPVRHGEWTAIDASYWRWLHDGAHPVRRIKYCHDECGKIVITKEPYCPNCGAKMDGGMKDG